MRLLDLIERKRDGAKLTAAEIEQFVHAVVGKQIPDYQISALLMAIYFRGMDAEEIAAMTRAMVRSGRVADLSSIPGVKVDKHSTGGVGDKISLPLAPAVAACGGRVPMISGRSLGHTGGTLDKLESIPRFDVKLTEAALRAQVATYGLGFGAATADLAPADKVLYEMRDATATVPSIALITSSILSKKVASGISALVLDVKTGSGAFLPAREQANALARSLVDTATQLGLPTIAWITDMDEPLGRAVGNALEIVETIETLSGEGPPDVVELTSLLGGEMLVAAGLVGDVAEGRARIERSLNDGTALRRWREVVAAQGGDVSTIDDPKRLPRAKHRETICATKKGVVQRVDARAIGVAATNLGAGRQKIEDVVKPGVGIVLESVRGDAVTVGSPLCEVHFDDEDRFAAERDRILGAFAIGDFTAPSGSRALERVAANEA